MAARPAADVEHGPVQPSERVLVDRVGAGDPAVDRQRPKGAVLQSGDRGASTAGAASACA